MFEVNEMKVPRNIIGKTKINRIRSQQIWEFCCIKSTVLTSGEKKNSGTKIRMDTERLVKISRDNIPVGRKSPGSPKRRWSELIAQ